MTKFNIFNIIIFVCFCYVNCSASKKNEVVWDNESKALIDKDRNLQWQLSMIADEWRVAEHFTLPKNAQFCAVADEYAIVVMYSTYPIPENQLGESPWNGHKDIKNAFKDAAVLQASIFPGIKYSEPIIENIYYLFKEAVCITISCDISDAHQSTNDAIPWVFRSYSFVKCKEAIQVMVMFPQVFYDIFGDEPFDDIFCRFSYIDATKELK